MTTKLADALETAAEALAALALEYRAYGDGGGMPPTRAPDAPGAPSFDELPADASEWERAEWDAEKAERADPKHGSAAVCPAHNIEYRPGKYGPYCPSLGTDPKWTNDRGYCQITPAKAAAYLRQKAADPGPLPVTR